MAAAEGIDGAGESVCVGSAVFDALRGHSRSSKPPKGARASGESERPQRGSNAAIQYDCVEVCIPPGRRMSANVSPAPSTNVPVRQLYP